MTLLLWTWLLPVVAGTSLVFVLTPGRYTSVFLDLLLRVVLGVGAGIGLSGFVFLWLLITGLRSGPMILATEAAIAALLAAWWYRRQPAAPGVVVSDLLPTSRLLCVCLGVAFTVACWKWIAFMHAQQLAVPEGGGDALAIWNLRAKFLATDQWRLAYAPEIRWSNQDYPLMLPAWVARGWGLAGSHVHAVPQQTTAAFTYGTVLLLVTGVALARGLSHALLAGTFLLGCTAYLLEGTQQQADVPQSFFFLGTLVSLARYDVSARHSGWLVVAGIFAGMGTSVKNEGMAFLVAATAAVFAVTAFQRGWRDAAGTLLYFLAGAAPFVMQTVAIKQFLAPPSWLTWPGDLTLSQRIGTLERHRMITYAIYNEFRLFAGFPRQLALPLLAMYALVAGFRVPTGHAAPGIALVALTVNLVCVYLVYVVSPFDLAWHLSTSMSRLFTQWLPSLLFLWCLCLNTPERLALARAQAGEAESAVTANSRQT